MKRSYLYKSVVFIIYLVLYNYALSREYLWSMEQDYLHSNLSVYKMVGLDKVNISSDKMVTIGIIDTGIDLNNPLLSKFITNGVNLVENDKPTDDNGHGTQISSLISSFFWYAHCPANLRIIPIKAVKGNGTCSTDNITEGIYQAVRRGANIINLSIETYVDSFNLRKAVEYAESKRVLVVASIGNQSISVGYPAAYPSVLAIGGVTEDKARAIYSNSGAEVDLVAPSKVYAFTLDSSYKEYNGTSLAAAQVSAAAGLVLLKYPELEPDQVRDIICLHTEDVGPYGRDDQTGYGLLRLDYIFR